MITSKFRIFALFTLLLFCAVIPLVNAFPAVSRFYVKMYANPSDSTINYHYVVGNYEILDFSQWGNLTAEGGNIGTPPIGRLDWHIVWIIDRTTLRSVIFGQFTMRFDSGQYAGKTVEGTCIIPNVTVFPSGGGQVVSGAFAGRGDMNVAGRVEPIEVPSGAAFVGYSW
jgi:hypothetical protein